MLYQRQALENQLHQWMNQSLQGDRQAYEKLLKQVADLLRGYLMNSLSNNSRTDERVEDLVQDVLVAIHRKKHLYQPGRPLLPWIFAIARYRVIDHFRAETRRPSTVEWDEGLDAPSREDIAAAHERVFELEDLLCDLPPRQREILLLAKADGMPLADIAERFQMSLSAVKVTVHRALQKVRQKRRV